MHVCRPNGEPRTKNCTNIEYRHKKKKLLIKPMDLKEHLTSESGRGDHGIFFFYHITYFNTDLEGLIIPLMSARIVNLLLFLLYISNCLKRA